MITGELKNKIDALWDIFAAGGLVNPLEVIEQITQQNNVRTIMEKKMYITPAMVSVALEGESIMAGSLTDDGSQGNFGGGTYNKGDAGSALVGDKRYFDSWSEE